MAVVSPYLFQSENGDMALPIEGLTVARCVVDFALSLEAFRGDDVVILRIEGPFTILENGAISSLDPEVPAKLGPAIALVQASVRSARAFADGRLQLIFEDGREITVHPNDEFEAWQLAGPGRVKAVCRVGGGISVWSEP
jgi:hypothetical protein